MSRFTLFNAPAVFVEVGQTSWQILNGEEFVELPLERGGNGLLTTACRARLVSALRGMAGGQTWLSRRPAFVAMGARGVSLRRMTLPPAPKEELQRLLRLQIEAEFPLSPDELAWGWQVLGQNGGRQEVLVAAMRKEIIEPCAQILVEAGFSPSFTLGALARNVLSPPPVPACSVLQIGATESELLAFQNGTPVSIRFLSWGAQSAVPPAPGSLGAKPVAGEFYLTGKGARNPAVAALAAQGIGRASPLPVLDGGGNERSPAIAGLKKCVTSRDSSSLLMIDAGESRAGVAGAAGWRWAAVAALLLAALLCFPYAEAVVLKPHLAKKLAILQADRVRLPAIDQELDFLQDLKRSQPPYLDTMYLISKVAPSGTSFESISMNRRGDLSLRGKMPNPQMVTEFRSNLIASAWFSSVTVEEQTPSPDRQVTVRMSARLKPYDARKPLADPSTNAPETKK